MAAGALAGCRASRGPGIAATTAQLVPRSRLSAGRRGPSVRGEGGDDEARRFPGVAGRPPGCRRCGELAATAQSVPRSRLLAGRRVVGARGRGPRRGEGALLGAAGRPPGLSWSGDSGNDGPAGAPLAPVCRAAGPFGARRGRRRRSATVPRGRRSAAGPLVVLVGVWSGLVLPARARGAPPGPGRSPFDQRNHCELGEYAPSWGGESGSALIDASRRPLGAIPARPERGSVPRCPYCSCSSARREGGGGGEGVGRPSALGLVSVSPRLWLPGVMESAANGVEVSVEGVSETESRSGLATIAHSAVPGCRSGRARPVSPFDPDKRDARRVVSAGDRPGRARSPS